MVAHTENANRAQNQPNQSMGIVFIVLLSLALFLTYAVNNHLITHAFSYCMSLLFDGFTIKNNSLIADIVLLVAFLLMLFGLFCLFKFFMQVAVVAIIVIILAWLFLAPKNEIKLNSGNKFEKVYGG